jgi:hypothetical protein
VYNRNPLHCRLALPESQTKFASGNDVHPREGRKKIEKGKKLPILYRCMSTATTHMSHDLGTVTIFRLLRLGLGFGLGKGLGLG